MHGGHWSMATEGTLGVRILVIYHSHRRVRMQRFLGQGLKGRHDVIRLFLQKSNWRKVGEVEVAATVERLMRRGDHVGDVCEEGN